MRIFCVAVVGYEGYRVVCGEIQFNRTTYRSMGDTVHSNRCYKTVRALGLLTEWLLTIPVSNTTVRDLVGRDMVVPSSYRGS